ncbi:NAD(P)H-binding protein [Gordonia sp. (in: high G+C Gram-positive bacteria)]|uniref:NAD(P)H-binding protein n=1 Tax=Gordonia sp. (in: high G+C Gram-positive bacteria) TaxID=84139 RepID=UPI00168DACF2|nr:NAD(P)H-binding protein [Gordonia sp. (in: high G+C Gram-positive bacteria)]NLG46789.1 NAD(P)H-binding protein [Gordonia sp. (in: high G+C Gram-positive bacteria)]
MAAITIIGGHGKIALLLAPLLVARGDSVTSLIRNPEHAAEVAATGATPVVFDIETATPDAFAEALRGADAVVFSAGAGGGNPTRTYAVDRDAAIASMTAAQAADIRRYVMVSYLGARPDHGVPSDNSFFAYAEAKAAADVALRTSDLDWTILMPGRLTLDAPSGAIDPSAERADANPGTSRANVALVAAAALATPSTIGKDIPFTDGVVPIEQALG